MDLQISEEVKKEIKRRFHGVGSASEGLLTIGGEAAAETIALANVLLESSRLDLDAARRQLRNLPSNVRWSEAGLNRAREIVVEFLREHGVEQVA